MLNKEQAGAGNFLPISGIRMAAIMKTKRTSSSVREQLLQLLDQQIEKHLEDSRFNAEFLAEQVGLSSRQLQRRLREATGCSVNQYIREARLQHGRRLLESGAFLVKQAAAAAGFRDAHYFSTLYKNRFGALPADVAEQILAGD